MVEAKSSLEGARLREVLQHFPTETIYAEFDPEGEGDNIVCSFEIPKGEDAKTDDTILKELKARGIDPDHPKEGDADRIMDIFLQRAVDKSFGAIRIGNCYRVNNVSRGEEKGKILTRYYEKEADGRAIKEILKKFQLEAFRKVLGGVQGREIEVSGSCDGHKMVDLTGKEEELARLLDPKLCPDTRIMMTPADGLIFRGGWLLADVASDLGWMLNLSNASDKIDMVGVVNTAASGDVMQTVIDAPSLDMFYARAKPTGLKDGSGGKAELPKPPRARGDGPRMPAAGLAGEQGVSHAEETTDGEERSSIDLKYDYDKSILLKSQGYVDKLKESGWKDPKLRQWLRFFLKDYSDLSIIQAKFVLGDALSSVYRICESQKPEDNGGVNYCDQALKEVSEIYVDIARIFNGWTEQTNGEEDKLKLKDFRQFFSAYRGDLEKLRKKRGLPKSITAAQVHGRPGAGCSIGGGFAGEDEPEAIRLTWDDIVYGLKMVVGN